MRSTDHLPECSPSPPCERPMERWLEPGLIVTANRNITNQDDGPHRTALPLGPLRHRGGTPRGSAGVGSANGHTVRGDASCAHSQALPSACGADNTRDERVRIEGQFPCLGSEDGIPCSSGCSAPRIPQYGHLSGLSLR